MTNDQHKWLGSISAVITLFIFITGKSSLSKLQERTASEQQPVRNPPPATSPASPAAANSTPTPTTQPETGRLDSETLAAIENALSPPPKVTSPAAANSTPTPTTQPGTGRLDSETLAAIEEALSPPPKVIVTLAPPQIPTVGVTLASSLMPEVKLTFRPPLTEEYRNVLVNGTITTENLAGSTIAISALLYDHDGVQIQQDNSTQGSESSSITIRKDGQPIEFSVQALFPRGFRRSGSFYSLTIKRRNNTLYCSPKMSI